MFTIFQLGRYHLHIY